jgi:hypothetical protein
MYCVLTCAIYHRIKLCCVWLRNTVHTVIYMRTQRVYSFLAIIISIWLQKAKIIEESHCVGLFKWNLVQRPAVARRWKVKRSTRQWSIDKKWSVGYMLWWYILIVGLSEHFYWKLRQIFRRNKYREDKLLLYHCLLELGTQKVNVSEQLYWVGIKFYFCIGNKGFSAFR